MVWPGYCACRGMRGKPESPLGTLRRAFARLGTGLRAAWVNHLRAWLDADWFAGIKPLPPTMASKVAAVAMIGSIITVSLVYGENYLDGLWRGRLMASDELSHERQTDVPNEETTPNTEATPAPAAPALPAPNQIGEPFIDRFDQPTLGSHWFVSDGWGNGPHMDNDWRKSQVSTGPNGLVLTLDKSPPGEAKPLVSGEVRTMPFYRYGYFEVNMKVPRGSGLVTGIFTYAHIDGRVRSNEIDVEILGRDTRTLEATIHENGKSTHKRVRLPFDSADGFHTFGFDWQPGYVRWYADGKMIFEEAGPAAARLVRPQQLIFDVWGSTQLKSWVGPIDHNRAPWTLEIKCAAYQPTYPGRELCTAT